MDLTCPGNIHKRFKVFKQKCGLIFEKPFSEIDVTRKVRHMMLWIGDSGLEIYNASNFSNNEDKLRIETVLEKLEAYRKPKSKKKKKFSSGTN